MAKFQFFGYFLNPVFSINTCKIIWKTCQFLCYFKPILCSKLAHFKHTPSLENLIQWNVWKKCIFLSQVTNQKFGKNWQNLWMEKFWQKLLGSLAKSCLARNYFTFSFEIFLIKINFAQEIHHTCTLYLILHFFLNAQSTILSCQALKQFLVHSFEQTQFFQN